MCTSKIIVIMNQKYILIVNGDKINVLDMSNVDNDEIKVTEIKIKCPSRNCTCEDCVLYLHVEVH